MPIGTQSDWHLDAIFYQVYVRGFQDSDNDGIGDLNGLISRLDYLQQLGVTCLWLMPILESPLRDDGYDVSNFLAIDPTIGSVDDFERLTAAAHARQLKVVTDLVVSHTSAEHAWFQDAKKGPESRFYNYYVWSDDDKKYADARIIFNDIEDSNWAWCSTAKQFYWHRFFAHQPDLNYANIEVQDTMLANMRFWLERGIDGFRVDAVPYLFEREGTTCENLPETHAFCQRMRQLINDHYPDCILLAEANQWPEELIEYFGKGDEFHMAFNFPLMPRIYLSVKQEDSAPIIDILERLPAIPTGCQWATFLRNHDELTLEMVSDPERDYMVQSFANEPRMRLNRGIRRRLAPLMDNDRRQIELLYSILLSLPGSPVIYYGDEIGMGDNIYLGDRNGVRTPMQWSSDRNAGFSQADRSELYQPINVDAPYHYQAINVESQLQAPASLLNWLTIMLQARGSHKVFSRGAITFPEANNRCILALTREWRGDIALVIHNLSKQPQPTHLDLSRYQSLVPHQLLGMHRFPAITSEPYVTILSPYASLWFLLRQPSQGQEA